MALHNLQMQACLRPLMLCGSSRCLGNDCNHTIWLCVHACVRKAPCSRTAHSSTGVAVADTAEVLTALETTEFLKTCTQNSETQRWRQILVTNFCTPLVQQPFCWCNNIPTAAHTERAASKIQMAISCSHHQHAGRMTCQ